jgi:hypothetical protein
LLLMLRAILSASLIRDIFLVSFLPVQYPTRTIANVLGRNA